MTHRGRFWNLERCLITFCVVASASMWYAAQEYGPAARRFPQIVSAAVFLLSAYFLIGQVLAWKNGADTKQPENEAEQGEKQRDKDVPTIPWTHSLALCLGFIGVTYAFGLGTGLLVLVTACAAGLGLRLWKAVLYGALFSAVIWLTFGVLLNITLPEGMLLNLY